MLKRIFGRFRPPPTLSSLEAYHRWAASYPPQAHNPLMQAEQQAMLDLFPDMQGKLALDLACGTGRYGRLAAERGASVVGLDNSAAMLRHGLGRVALASVEAIPLKSDSVDVVLCGLALGHLPRLTPSLGEISRVLKPGGCALVSDFHPLLALNGGRRTFTAPDGRTYAVEHHVHLYSDYHQAARRAGLRVADVVEPRSGHPSAPPGWPVAIIYRFIKND
ncbi:MAG: class I SAM-dependent methyltransferase [Chloroflexi bacterium]|nr:class I SAM-dependent methyltransferase [Chloroflexota bacterium]